MSLNLTIAILALMVFVNYRLVRSVLYPPFIFCLMWLLDLTLYRASFIEIDELHESTLFFVGAGALLFSIGGFASHLIPRPLVEMKLRVLPVVRRSRAPKFLLIGFMALSVPLIIHDRIAKAAQGTGDSFLERSRNATNEMAEQGERSQDYVINSILPAGLLILLLFQLEEHDWTFWCAAGFALLTSLVGGGRTETLTLLVSVLGIHMIRNHKESLGVASRVVRWPMLFFVVFFVGFVYLAKDTGSYGTLGNVAAFFLVGYIVGPVAAFDQVLRHPTDFPTSQHTFQFFLKRAADLHLLTYSPPPVLDSFTFVPFPTNVYTVYRFYFIDFGAIGCLATIAILGFLHSLLHQRAQLQNRLALILFGYSLFAVVMVIFDDHYYIFGFYLRTAFLCGLYWTLSSFRWSIFPAPPASGDQVTS